jgi:flagellar biosynthesis protein FlhF
MKIRRFYGKDMREALKQVKAELGGDAVIMSNKKVANGVELVAAYDNEPLAKAKIAVPHKEPGEYPNAKKVPTLSEIIGDSGPDSLKALLEKQAANAVGDKDQVKVATRSETTASASRHVQSHSEQQGINEIRQELASLRNVLQFQVSGLLQQQKQRNHPLHGYLIARLEQMGIHTELAEEVVSYAPDDIDERQAWLFLLRLLANTIAKLAAQYALKYGPEQVALITIDSYRIAAYEQLATYGKIIGCSVKKAQSAEELSDQLYQLRHKRLILIDTAGFGQRDARLIKQLDTLNGNSCATIKKYLIMQANSQYQVMDYTIRAYKQISLQGCIFTKLDECYSLGEAISAAIVHRLPVSYVTDGQKVPEDMKVADAKYLITTAAKLYKKYGLSHTTTQGVVHSAAAV